MTAAAAISIWLRIRLSGTGFLVYNKYSQQCAEYTKRGEE
ncbi:hypothetical protein CBFG_02972 [Clostridiales bacterium 1_7_47FAA]|nr:hypothetical protein CBFG_02972 [Clostridiales bacterium 1_7_47FAA]